MGKRKWGGSPILFGMTGVKGTSLGSVSEASSVFDANLIAPLIKERANKSIPLEKDPQLKNLCLTITQMSIPGTFPNTLPPVSTST